MLLASQGGSWLGVAAPRTVLRTPQCLATRRRPSPLHGRQQLGAAQLRLRCAARITSSRDSLDEEQLEQQAAAGRQTVNGRPRAPDTAPGALQQAADARQSRLEQQQDQQQKRQQQQQPQQPAGAPRQGPPRRLSVQQLQQLTELHVGDAYALGVVGSAAELAECLETDLRDGLDETPEGLAVRAERYGRNAVRPPREVTFWQLVAEALQDFTILVLLGAGCLSLLLEFAVNQQTAGEGSWIEGASILVAVGVVVLVTAVNNYQKEQQFRLLQAVSEDVKVRAIRGGREQAVPVRDVLVGDLLLVEAGDILCADGMLVAGSELKVDESHLTGEADDVSKNPLARPSLLGGSKVLSGFGRMLVTAVGPNSQSGAIAEMVADGTRPAGGSVAVEDGLREETLLQRKLAEYATSIGQFGLGAAALAFVAMAARFSFDTFVVQGASWDWSFAQSYLNFFITGVTILVVAVPEGLPLAVTLALAFSVRRMLADNNLVRHLSAAETMGTATVVCSDKTGTLTQNNMVVSKLWLAGHLLPDLKPYTRREPHRQGSTSTTAGLAKLALAAAGGGGSGGPGGAAATAATPPLAELVRSTVSGASLGGSGSVDEANAALVAPQASLVEPNAAGSAAPADVTRLLVESISLNSTANIYSDTDGQERRTGNRTEIALLDLARLLGAKPRSLRRQQRQLAQIPFSSERKRMTTASLPPGYDPGAEVHLCRIYTKGASEIVLDRCSHVLGPDGTRRRLHPEEKQQLMADFCQGGQRVLCLAFRDMALPAEALIPAKVFRATTGSDSEGAANSSDGDSPLRGAALAGLGGNWVWDAGALAAADSSIDENGALQWDEAASLADNLEHSLTLLALVGIEDPLRAEVPAAIRQCQASGITVKMLTGDNVTTATAIARECGILPPEGTPLAEAKPSKQGSLSTGAAYSRDSAPPSLLASGEGSTDAAAAGVTNGAGAAAAAATGLTPSGASCGPNGSLSATAAVAGLPDGVVMEGPEFRRRVLNEDGSINAGRFLELWPRLRVLARCSPADKYTIVTGVRSLTTDVVAVTGDGTNDAPALRAANVGFAMNAGTDTAKEAADIVLLDNNFASIVSAALWGRNVYANITRFLQFQLTINLVAVATAVTGAIVAAESPLTAVQMLWVNLIMDSLASLALATEPPDTRLLAIPPFSQEHEFVDPRTPIAKHIAGQAAYQLAVLYGLIFYAPALLGIPDHSTVQGPSVHYTLVFNTFVFMQLFNQLNARKILDSSHALEGLGSARWFQWILGGELVLQILIVQFGGSWFHTHPLNAWEWAVCVGLGATTLLLREGLRRVPYGRSLPFGS